jgi:hypothetical protein
MTFYEWLNEIEVFSSRQERLEEDILSIAVVTSSLSHSLARKIIYDWLEAAYAVGHIAGLCSRGDIREGE